MHRATGAQTQVALTRDRNRFLYVVRDNLADRMILQSCSVVNTTCVQLLAAKIPPAWPSWSLSPTGSRLAVIGYYADHTRASSVQVYDTQSGAVREIYRGQPWLDATKFFGVQWSPDERFLYFVKPLHQAGGDQYIWRVPVAGGQPQSVGISMPSIRMPTVDSTGRQLLFQGTTEGGTERIVVVESALIGRGR
jgi:hypothetical protein